MSGLEIVAYVLVMASLCEILIVCWTPYEIPDTEPTPEEKKR
jgi:hypothetical protein